MSLFTEISALSPLRKNQQIVSFFLLFVNAMMLAITTFLYVDTFGSEGLVIKGYATSVYGLILLMPFLGHFAIKYPLTAFKLSLAFEAISVIFYFCASQEISALITLPLATIFVISSGLLMRPVLTQANSIINAGCGQYSLLSSKLDACYTAIGALIGGLFIMFDTPVFIMILCFAFTLVVSRYYRQKVLIEIYEGAPENAQSDTDMQLSPEPVKVTI